MSGEGNIDNMDWDFFWYLGFVVAGYLLLDLMVIRPFVRKVRKGLVTEDMLKKELRELELRLTDQQTTDEPEERENQL